MECPNKIIKRYVLLTLTISLLIFILLYSFTFSQVIIYHDSYNGYLGAGAGVDIYNLKVKSKIHIPNGLEIKSYTDKWNETKLQLLYNELIKNRHGEEFTYLKEINIYPSMPETSNEMGLYQGYWSWNSKGARWYDKGVISLYNGDTITTIEEYARILSHEYGHHFTMYYIWVKEGKSFKKNGNWENSGYYRVREFDKYPLITADYVNGRYWTVHEIAAEDYIQLYGSSSVYQFENYFDILDRLYYKLENPEPIIQHYNVYPQENIHIPLAHDIPKIKGYWNKLANFEGEEIVSNSMVSLEWSYYEFYENDDKKRLDEFIVNTFNDIDDAYLYTLLVFNDFGKRYPICTLTSGKSSYCYFGYIQETVMESVYSIEEDSMEFREGINYFVVTAVNKSGVAFSSNKIILDFSNDYIYTVKEDYDLNGIVDDRDVKILLNHYGEKSNMYDNNKDGIVDLYDLVKTSKKVR